jgi:hypothetical protein
MAPPAAASGEQWPIDRQDVPPEKRPSISSVHQTIQFGKKGIEANVVVHGD